uniref:Uncharacterized protein n=1 Tax=Romanomermis culicivorax TaxID=13658 RepID=A0A915IR06_ROMCU
LSKFENSYFENLGLRILLKYSTFYVPDFKNDSSIDISIFYMNYANFEVLHNLYDKKKSESKNVEISLRVIKRSKILSGTIICLFCITLICIIFGGLWSGYTMKE